MSETPSKGDAESASPYQARKDKACPFCNKPFTSSSLGRHLDLWIKEKNPKPEDGIHDVEQIRKLRGAVTRRQQKKSLGSRRYSSTSVGTSAATPIPASRRSPTAADHGNPGSSSSARKDSAPAIPGFNVHNFAVTGVINDIESGEAHSGSNRAPDAVARQIKGSQLSVDVARKIQDAEDTARAAELALREMIHAWRAAKLHIDMTSVPFDFDPLSLDFPALTLQCLQPPPTLSSDNPFPAENSWSIQPPGRQQHSALRAYFAEEFKKWRISCAAATTALQEDIQYPPSEFVFMDDPQEAVRRAEKLAEELEKKVTAHVDTAYSIWQALPDNQRQDTWILELARSVGKKQTQIESLHEEQHRLRQENSNLRSQIDQLNKLQQPREFKVMRPATLPIDQKSLEYFQKEAVVNGRRTVGMNIDDRRLDIGTVVETAIDRWKRVVVSLRPPVNGVLGKRTAEQAGINGEDHAGTGVSQSIGPQQNKSRALPATNHQPQPRPERAGTLGAAGHSTNTHPSEPTRLPTERAVNTSDKDAEADPDDDVSDRDADAEHDDGMSDRDADAEMEDDHGMANSDANHGAAMPPLGSLSRAHSQAVPHPRHNSASAGTNGEPNGGGNVGSVRRVLSVGNGRVSH